MILISVIIVAVIVVGAAVVLSILSQRKRDETWRQFASEIGGEFVPGALFRSSKIQAHAGQAAVTVDTYTVSNGDTSTTYTRMRAPMQTSDGFEFSIERKGWIGRLDKALGTKHIDVGDADFDHDFLVRGNNEYKIQSLLLDQGLRREMQEQKSLQLAARKNELRLEVTGAVKDVDRLKALFRLFGEMLERVGKV